MAHGAIDIQGAGPGPKSIAALLALLVGTLAVSAWGVAANAGASELAEAGGQPDYNEGVHYHRLPVTVQTAVPGRIEVTEVFSYACIHCYTFDPILEGWRAGLPDDVAFRRVPALFNETWTLLARMYYAAHSLGVGEQMHLPLFEAIHKRGIDVRRAELAEELFQRGARVAAEDFNGAMASFDVATSLRQADAQGRMYRVTGVPTLIVNGKYRIGSGDVNGFEAMLRVADFLIDLEREAMRAAEAE